MYPTRKELREKRIENITTMYRNYIHLLGTTEEKLKKEFKRDGVLKIEGFVHEDEPTITEHSYDEIAAQYNVSVIQILDGHYIGETDTLVVTDVYKEIDLIKERMR